jgi:hypothetical protein
MQGNTGLLFVPAVFRKVQQIYGAGTTGNYNLETLFLFLLLYPFFFVHYTIVTGSLISIFSVAITISDVITFYTSRPFIL